MYDVHLYVFDPMNKVIERRCIHNTTVESDKVRRTAEFILQDYPNKFEAIAVPDRDGLKEEFWAAAKSRDFSDRFIFRDTVTKEGLCFHY